MDKDKSPRAPVRRPRLKVYSKWPFDATEASRRQDETAAALGLKKQLTLDLGKGITLKLVLIPAGKFLMGSPKDEKQRNDTEGPQHEVTISKPFYMGIHEVTLGQFAQFVDESGYRTEAEKEGWANAWDGKSWGEVSGASWKKPGFNQTDSHPVVCVSHNDAVAFCKWLAKRMRKTVRLPTEAEWEYACRAGTRTAYQWGDDPDDGKGWCNGADQSLKDKRKPSGTWAGFGWRDGHAFTSPAGSFRANGLGVYNMHGNVWEWCADWYDGDYYANAKPQDPQGPSSGKLRVLRGGDWAIDPDFCRSASRFWGTPDNQDSGGGFRVAVDSE